MACNCEGNTYNIGMGCCVPVVANADAYYTKSEIDEKIEEIVISGGVTSGEVQDMIDVSIADKADKSEIPTVPTNVSAFENDAHYITESGLSEDYATKQWVEDKHYITGVDLSDYALKSEIPSVEGLASETYVQNYTYDKNTIDGKIEEIVISGGGVTSGEVQNMIDASVSSATNDMATKTWVNNQGFLTQAVVDGKADTSAVTADIAAAVSGKVDTSTFTAYTASTDIVLSGKANTSAVTSVGQALNSHTSNTSIHVTTAQTAAWDAKSDFSGSYNDLTNKPTIPQIWQGTKAQYNALQNKDANTIYLIYEE